ncbi:MAG: hypothetical protein QOG28_1240, partial [Trebonia sp.]|nr:hypothetical protein [Trebonia sp.]
DYEADDYDSRGDDYRDDDYEDGGRAEEAGEVPARPTTTRRRAPVSRARR